MVDDVKHEVDGHEQGVRGRLLASTLAIIGADGVGALTNRRIAREAGVSLGSVTYHFPTQIELLRETLLTFVNEETRRLRELTAFHAESSVSLEEASSLASDVARDLAFTERQFATFELYLEAGRDPALRQAATECFEAYDALAAAILERIGIPEAASTARLIVDLITGIQLRRLATGGEEEDISPLLLAALQALIAR